jgi:hypothetical protein
LCKSLLLRNRNMWGMLECANDVFLLQSKMWLIV